MIVAKVEWHPGEPWFLQRRFRSSLIKSRPTQAGGGVNYNHRGTAEQHIKEGKNAINWTRLSCRKFRRQLHVRLQAVTDLMPTIWATS